MKCSKCGHRWHATAEEDAPEAQAAAPAAAPAETPAPEPEPKPETEAEPDSGTEAAPAATAAPTGETEAPAEEEAAAATADSEDADPASPLPPGMQQALGLATGEGDEDDVDNVESRGRRRHPARTTARKPRRSMARVLSIFVLLLVVCGAGAAAVLMKKEVMMWLPATQPLYAMIGMGPEVLGHGLQIAEPTPRKEIDGNDEILVVEGEVRNVADKTIDVPLMRGALLDATGKALHIWTFTAAKSRIAPGQNARYRTEFRNPPTEAQSLDITFTEPGTVPESAKLEQKDEGGMMTNSTARQH